MDLTRLAEPFDTDDIEWRIQRNGVSNGKPWAMVLCYITNRAIMERLDEVCGAENWQNEYKEWHGTSQLCGISIWTHERREWITKWDGADATQIESTKGGLSDSMKRAGVQWGIGRYLYKLETTFVDLIDGRSKDKNAVNVFVDKKNMHFMKPNLPDFAVPSGKKVEPKKPTATSPRKETAVVKDELTELKAQILTKYKESGKDASKFTDFLLETIGVDKVTTEGEAREVLDAIN